MTRLKTLALCATFATAIGSPAFSQSAQAPTGVGGYGVVTLAAKLTHSANVTDFKHPGPGSYLFQFNNDISKCSATATIARRGKFSVLPGFIVVGKSGKETLNVYTFLTTTLLAADYPFNVTVTC